MVTTERGRWLLTLLLLAVAGPAQAQSVINPKTLTFTASPDHEAVQSGQLLVERYEVQWYASGTTTPFQTDPIGKPLMDLNRVITVDLSAIVIGLPLGNTYTARVAAVGPGGSGVSLPSNPFDVALRAPTAPTAVSLSR